jgi:hypothetical protein
VRSERKLATIVVVEGRRRINSYVLRDCHNSCGRLSGTDLGNILSVRLHPPLDIIAQVSLYPTWVDESNCDTFVLEDCTPLSSQPVE